MAGNTLYDSFLRSTNILAHTGPDVAQICTAPLDTRGSRVQQIHLYHPITPPSTPPNQDRQHAMSVSPAHPKSMQSVISRAIPNVTVQHVQSISSVRSQRLYQVQISDGTSLFVALPPPLMVKLLRSEQGSISSEAVVLRWLTQLGLDEPLLPETKTEENKNAALSQETLSQTKLATSLLDPFDDTAHLSAFLPKLLAHSVSSNEFGIEYNVLRPTLGVPIAELSSPLSPAERRAVEMQTGHFSGRLSKLVSPTGRFGPAFAVLPSWSAPESKAPASAASRDANARMSESKGTRCWSMAFHSMLEAILRDGEDMAVMLGYAAIRRHYKRWAHTLDSVVTPRLVAVDAGSAQNTLVTRKSPPSQPGAPSRPSSDDDELGVDSPVDGSLEPSREEGTRAESNTAVDIEMTGMRDWSNFIFGDPLFATMFSSDPSEDFLAGFRRSENHEPHARCEPSSSCSSLGIIDDGDSAEVRLLLYGCYHTITQIVKEFYRPQRDSGPRELAARKKLTDLLGKLEELASDPSEGTTRSISP